MVAMEKVIPFSQKKSFIHNIGKIDVNPAVDSKRRLFGPYFVSIGHRNTSVTHFQKLLEDSMALDGHPSEESGQYCGDPLFLLE